MPTDIMFMTTVLPTLILTAGGVGAAWIITRAWLRGRKDVPPAELVKISESLELLQHSVDDLRDDLRIHVNEIRELSGRVEFAERLLTAAKDKQISEPESP